MNVGIFCGSRPGTDRRFVEEASEVGRRLAERGIGVVYGGGRVGLMGAVADGALAAGGTVIGVIPQALVEREVEHRELTELRIVDSMHERKQAMSDLSDGFIALPGGAGTLEEISEQWTWAQLAIHRKPCALLDVYGYYAHMSAMITTMVAQGFLNPDHADMLIVSDDLDEILRRFADYRPATV